MFLCRFPCACSHSFQSVTIYTSFELVSCSLALNGLFFVKHACFFSALSMYSFFVVVLLALSLLSAETCAELQLTMLLLHYSLCQNKTTAHRFACPHFCLFFFCSGLCSMVFNVDCFNCKSHVTYSQHLSFCLCVRVCKLTQTPSENTVWRFVFCF